MKEELLIELGLKIKDLLIEYKANQFTWEEIKARVDTEYKLLTLEKKTESETPYGICSKKDSSYKL